VAALAPTPLDRAERLAVHYAAEVRLADVLVREAESLARYPEPRRRILEAAEHANRRARRLRQALEETGHSAPQPATANGLRAPTGWGGLRAGVAELASMSEAYLADAYAMERRHPGIAALMRALHREAAGDQRDLIWTLAQLTRTTVTTTSPEEVAA
jgi:uncharacterized protein YjiS (DUF1127 family)